MSEEPGAAAAAASFRDPAGRLVAFEGRLLRLIGSAGAEDFRAFFESALAGELRAAGQLVAAKVLGAAETAAVPGAASAALVVEHERVFFPSYPHEWPPEMLHEAGRLTLDLARRALPQGFGLKDATPYNVLFRGPEPVFVDWLSFERRESGDPTWLAYAQFVRTFLLPLLASRRFGLSPAQVFLAHRDGLEPEQLYRLCGPVERFLPPLLGLVTLPTWLSGRAEAQGAQLYEKKRLDNPEKARFILAHLLKGLEKPLARLAPKEDGRSPWSSYMAGRPAHYSEEQFGAKERFVRAALEEVGAKRVLDVGCNTGYFSERAARTGARVVAIDLDPVVVGRLWRRARAERLDILPLAVNLARPSPALGWRNRECPSFLERATGAFDCVLMLALLHHLLASERIPLEEVLLLAARLTSDAVVIEFISPDDLMFEKIARGREALHAGLTRDLFERTSRKYFKIVRSEPLEGASRWLYLLRKK